MITPRRLSSERRIADFAGDQRLQPFLEAANPVFGFADPTRRLDQRRVQLGAIAADLGYLRFELPVCLRARRHGVFKRPQVFLALRLLLHGLACHRRDLAVPLLRRSRAP